MRKFLLFLALILSFLPSYGESFDVVFTTTALSNAAELKTTDQISTNIVSGSTYISSIASTSKVYRGDSDNHGLRFNNSSTAGNVTFNVANDVSQVKASAVKLTLYQYGLDGASPIKVTITDTSSATKDFTGTVSSNGYVLNCELEPSLNISSIKIEGTKASKGRFYLSALSIEKASITPPATPYEVTFNAGNGSCGTTSLTESSAGAGVTLPTATASVSGWEFAGWAVASCAETTTAPTLYTAGSTYHPTQDCILYAVYSQGNGNSNDYQVTTNLTPGKYVLGAVKAAASAYLANNTAIGAITFSSMASWGSYTNITPDANGVISSPSKDAVWDLTGDATNGYVLKKGSLYLYLKTSTGESTAGTDYSEQKIYVEDASSTCKDAFLVRPSSSSTNKLFLNTANNYGYRMYGSTTNASASMCPYIRFYKNSANAVYNSNPTAGSESEDVAVTGVTLSPTTLTLEVGETATLTATVEPANATNQNVSWSTGDSNVATVANGVVTAVGAGNTTITVTTADGGKTATCQVTVNAPAAPTPIEPVYTSEDGWFNVDYTGVAAGQLIADAAWNGYGIAFAKDSATNAPSVDAGAIHLYSNNTITLSQPEGKVIEKVEIATSIAGTKFSADNASASKASGVVTIVPNSGYNLNDAVITLGAAGTVTNIKVYFADAPVVLDTCAAPTISAGSTAITGSTYTISEATAFSFATTTDGATLSYRIGDSGDFTTGTSVTISETCTLTVKAHKDGYNDATTTLTITYQAPVTPPSGDDVYTLATDANQLCNGDKIVIVANGIERAMSNISSSGNNFSAYTFDESALTEGGNYITINENFLVLELENKGTTWRFKIVDGDTNNVGKYLMAPCANSGSNNRLQTTSTPDNLTNAQSADATISITNVGIATIKFGDNRGYVKYNGSGSNDLFACYGSGYTDVKIYYQSGVRQAPELPVVKIGATSLANDGSTEVVYNTALTVSSLYATSLKYKWGESGEVQTLTGKNGNITVNRAGTLYVWGSNGMEGETPAVFTHTFTLAAVGAPKLMMGDTELSTTAANTVRRGTQVTASAVGATTLDMIADQEDLNVEDVALPYNFRITEAGDVTLQAKAGEQTSSTVDYSFALLTPGEVTFTPEAVQGERVRYETHVVIASENADRIIYSIDGGTNWSTATAPYTLILRGNTTVTAVGIVTDAQGYTSSSTVYGTSYRGLCSAEATRTYEVAAEVAAPQFGMPSGIHTHVHTLDITAPSGCTIYYSIDSPDCDQVYDPANAPLIDRTMTVFAKAVDANNNESDIVSATYQIKSIVTVGSTEEGELNPEIMGLPYTDSNSSTLAKTNSSYVSDAYPSQTTGIPYTYNVAGGNYNTLQINTERGKGIAATHHNVGYAQKVTYRIPVEVFYKDGNTWKWATYTVSKVEYPGTGFDPIGSNVVLDIYGANNAYASADDLSDPLTQGELLVRVPVADPTNISGIATTIGLQAVTEADVKGMVKVGDTWQLVEMKKEGLTTPAAVDAWIASAEAGYKPVKYTVPDPQNPGQEIEYYKYFVEVTVTLPEGHKYVGIRPSNGTMIANYTIEWGLADYSVGDAMAFYHTPDATEGSDGYDTECPLFDTRLHVNGADDGISPTADDQYIPYGSTVHLTAPNATHIQHSWTEAVDDDVNHAETATNSSVDIVATQSGTVWYQGMLQDLETGQPLAVNARSSVNLKVLPGETEFFPYPGNYRTGTVITGTVANANGGTATLTDGTVLPIDKNGQFTFTFTASTNVTVKAWNSACGEDHSVTTLYNHAHNDDSTLWLFELSGENARPSTPIANYRSGSTLTAGTELQFLIDGSESVYYMVIGLDEEAPTSSTDPRWIVVTDDNEDIEQASVILTDDCKVYAYGENSIGNSDIAGGTYYMERPRLAMLDINSGDVEMGRSVTISSLGADEIHYIVRDAETNEVVRDMTVSGNSTQYTITRPVTIEAWGSLCGAEGLHSTAEYTIKNDKVYVLLTDLANLFPEGQTTSEVVIANKGIGYALSNSVTGDNVPLTRVYIEDDQILNPSNDVLTLTVEENTVDDLSGYSFQIANGNYMGPKASGNKATLCFSTGLDAINIATITPQTGEGTVAGDMKIQFTGRSDRNSLLLNTSGNTTIGSCYNESNGSNAGYNRPQLYVLDPTLKVYPPDEVVFDHIDGAYPLNEEITVSSFGATSLYVKIVPVGTSAESINFTRIDGSEYTFALMADCTVYAYGANQAGTTSLDPYAQAEYAVRLSGAPVFDPEGGEVERNSTVRIYCSDAPYINYVTTDVYTDIIDSDLLPTTICNEEGEFFGMYYIEVTVTQDCRITAYGRQQVEIDGVTTITDGPSAWAEYTINRDEDFIYYQIKSTADLKDGDIYLMASKEGKNGAGMLGAGKNHLAAVDITHALDLATDPVKIENPDPALIKWILRDNGDGTWSLRSQRKNMYLSLKTLTANPDMDLENEVADDNQTKVTIDFDANGNALIKFGEVGGSDVLMQYNTSSPRFKAYNTAQGVMQLYRRTYVPVDPTFEPDGGYYQREEDLEVTITSLYATSINYDMQKYNAETSTWSSIQTGTPTANSNGKVTVTIPADQVPTGTLIRIVAKGINAAQTAEQAPASTSSVYYFGDIDEFSLITDIADVISTEGTTNRYLIGYDHVQSPTNARTLKANRPDGSGITAVNVSLDDDVLIVPFSVDVMRLNLTVTASTATTRDATFLVTATGGSYITGNTPGRLTTDATATTYTVEIGSEAEGYIAKIGDGNGNYIAYNLNGGYYTLASALQLEGADYAWPQLFRTDVDRLPRPTIASFKDSSMPAAVNNTNYAIGKRTITVSNYSDYASDVTLYYTTDGSLPTSTNGEVYNPNTGVLMSISANEYFSGVTNTWKFRAVAYADGKRRSKSSVLQTYVSPLHVADITEYEEQVAAHGATDGAGTIYKWAIDGDLYVANSALNTVTNKWELILSDGEEGNYHYLLNIIETPIDGETGFATNPVTGTSTALRGMMGYHGTSDLTHMEADPSDLTSTGLSRYFNKRDTSAGETENEFAVEEVRHTDGNYHSVVKGAAAINDDGLAHTRTAHTYAIDAVMANDVKLAVDNRYAVVTDHHAINHLKGYVFGKEAPVLYLTQLLDDTRVMPTLNIEVYDRHQRRSYGETVTESTAFDVRHPVCFTLSGANNDVIDLSNATIFYTKDGSEIDIASAVANARIDKSVIGEEPTAYTSGKMKADAGTFIYTQPFYITNKWSNAAADAIGDVTIKAVAVLNPNVVYLADIWQSVGDDFSVPATCAWYEQETHMGPNLTIFGGTDLRDYLEPFDVDDQTVNPRPSSNSGNTGNAAPRRAPAARAASQITGSNYEPIVEGGAVKTATSQKSVTSAPIVTGIEGIDYDLSTGDGTTRYYNVQGIEMPDTDHLAPGVYIRVQDGRAEKVLVK